LFSTLDLGSEFFGEGITLVKDESAPAHVEIGCGFVYDIEQFSSTAEFSYSGEGWGLATNGREVFLE